ncbi:hypothetical protein AAC387_Pa07g2068 [Persea americana]
MVAETEKGEEEERSWPLASAGKWQREQHKVWKEEWQLQGCAGRDWQQSKFEIATDEQPRVKKWVFDKICQFWKNWKSKLKKTHYDPFHTTRERLQYRPDRVDPVQWVLLIEFWGTKDGMERSKRNAENRALQTMNHTAGTKSFARIREEERARNLDGQAPDRMEMFRLTHTRRDGQIVDWASEDALRRLNERVSQQLESPERSCARDDIFTQVMGEDRRGRVRTFGLGVTPFDIYGPRVSVAEAREMANAERAQRIAAEQRVVAVEERMSQMEARMNQMMTCFQMFAQHGHPSSSFEPVGSIQEI